ncbi:hypothetical protein [Bordetella genomosp. 9]|uniref:hypothetical protein n=1 Tax=Bordetella genomosp. 9 TaxID=1416803 RepID=UPI000A322F7D|nr:hypothetical protein [Bordetella genomosp. 9]
MPETNRPASPDAPERDPKSPTESAEEKARMGTRILPEPDKAPIVAGMPREGRVLSDPGHPGIPRPEDDVYANEPSDLSERDPATGKNRP